MRRLLCARRVRGLLDFFVSKEFTFVPRRIGSDLLAMLQYKAGPGRRRRFVSRCNGSDVDSRQH
jgi:hypothetical protein